MSGAIEDDGDDDGESEGDAEGEGEGEGEESDSEDEDEEWLREVARAPFAAIPDLIGERFGRYNVKHVLGAGGMGVVYLAEDEKLGRSIALKVLPSSDRLGDDDDRRKRFVREARLAAKLTHPAIATVYDAGEIGERAFLAMEYVPGVSLREKLKNGPLELLEVVRIGRAVAGGLAVAHAARIIHRDIKPENVMIGDDDGPTEQGKDPIVKVLDFGAAKLQQLGPTELSSRSSSTDTHDGRIIGTPAYMSPEQAKGGRVDARSDVFSLGALLYEMTTGRRPFEGKTSGELLIAIDRDEPAPISTKDRRVPTALIEIIKRCLQKDPAKRFASGADVLRALKEMKGSTHHSWIFVAAVAAIASAIALVTIAHGSGRSEKAADAVNAVTPSIATEPSVSSANTPPGASSVIPSVSTNEPPRLPPAVSERPVVRRVVPPPTTTTATATTTVRSPLALPSSSTLRSSPQPGPLDEPK